MSRYAIIESNTDMRDRRTKVTFTTSLAVAKKAKEKSGALAYADAVSSQNFHRRVVDVYELPVGWRKPSLMKLQEEAFNKRRSRGAAYYIGAQDVLASMIFSTGRYLEV